VLGRWTDLARKSRVAIVAGTGVVALAAAAFGFRQWHYMEHDNRFCTSCHLMHDPFERFGRSAHARLECHDCHKATTAEKLHQLYATVVDHPTVVAGAVTMQRTEPQAEGSRPS